MILGTGKTIREAKDMAMETLGRIWSERGVCATDNTNAILLVEPGIGVKLQNDGNEFVVMGMCDAKVHHFGRKMGYENIEFLRSPKSPWMPLIEYIGMMDDKKVYRTKRGIPRKRNK